MPRYYKDRIYTEQQRKRIAHFQKLAIEKNIVSSISKDKDFFAKSASKTAGAFKKMANRSREVNPKI